MRDIVINQAVLDLLQMPQTFDPMQDYEVQRDIDRVHGAIIAYHQLCEIRLTDKKLNLLSSTLDRHMRDSGLYGGTWRCSSKLSFDVVGDVQLSSITAQTGERVCLKIRSRNNSVFITGMIYGAALAVVITAVKEWCDLVMLEHFGFNLIQCKCATPWPEIADKKPCTVCNTVNPFYKRELELRSSPFIDWKF